MAIISKEILIILICYMYLRITFLTVQPRGELILVLFEHKTNGTPTKVPTPPPPASKHHTTTPTPLPHPIPLLLPLSLQVLWSIYIKYAQYLLCIDLLWLHHQFLHTCDLSTASFRVASLVLGQSYDCPSASEATLKDMGKINWYQTTSKHNKGWTMWIFPGINYTLCESLIFYNVDRLNTPELGQNWLYWSDSAPIATNNGTY